MFDQSLKWVTFDVVLCSGVMTDHGRYYSHVFGSDMPLIGAWMHGDTVRPRVESHG
jgi:hypothetical protein